MSGRAGRRGLDDKGIVIAMIDEKMDTSVAKSILLVSMVVLISDFQYILVPGRGGRVVKAMDC